MKITYKGDYALKAILDLTLYGSSAERVEDIAQRQDIPFKFLEQIMLDLKKGRFVKSRRGRNGGYLLARAPEKITLGEVIRYFEGQVEPISCVQPRERSRCNYAAQCVFYDVFDEIGKYIAHKVDGINFAQLKEKQKEKLIRQKKYLDYSI